MTSRRLLLALLLASSSVACTPNLHIDTPGGFAELEDQDRYAYRATTSRGVVLAVRREANDPSGDLSFWSGALDAHLRRRGYKAITATDVKSKDGVDGRQIRYEIKRNGRPHGFWMTVFVTDDSVVTVESGGDTAFLGKRKKELAKAIASLEVG